MKALSTEKGPRIDIGLSKAILRFTQEMQHRLDTSGRKGYANVPFSELLNGLEKNLAELRERLIDRQESDDSSINASAADIANYAMFICLNNIYNERS